MSTIPVKRGAPVTPAEAIAQARKRAEEVRARIGASKNGGRAPPIPSTVTPAPVAPADHGSATTNRLADMKKRIEAMRAAVRGGPESRQSTSGSPALQTNQQSDSVTPPTNGDAHARDDFQRVDGQFSGGGGLSAPIHPSLLADIQEKAESGGKGTKSSGRKVSGVVNPYLGEEKAYSVARKLRKLEFTHTMHHRPAMVAANEMRRKEALEVMRKRIEGQREKAGLNDSAELQVFAVPMPPDVEFWDESLQSNIDNNDLITNLILHPILIEPPQEKFISKKPLELMLTEKERKKMRKIKRMEVHKEEQAKIRLGLVPTPAPKIKHSNVMRVYGEMAVQDPTAVEAMVNKQVEDRLNTHLQTNADRQLTKEQKAEKLQQKAEEDAKKGLNLLVFKINLPKDDLLGKHRFLIDCNAKQMLDITGFVIVAPNFSLCLVEAGEHSTRFYKKIMLRRIKWQGILQGGGVVQDAEQWKEGEDHTCVLLHQGQIRERKFKKWGSFRETETEAQAKEALTRAKLDNFWVQAKALETAG